MRAVFCTHCSDDWYEPVGCFKLEWSLRHFHPDVPFVRYGSAEIGEQFRREPGLHWDVLIPIWGKLLAREYDLVVHLDADSIVTAPLDDVLRGGYDVAGVRNNDDFGDMAMSCPNVSPADYLNCGLVAATNPDFWDEWHRENLLSAHLYPVAENDVFNQIFYSGRYRARLLDPPDAPSYYGHAAHPARWGEITLRDDRLYLRGKVVRVLHQAGGHTLPKLRLTGQFDPTVVRWLMRLTDSPCLLDATGRYRGLGYPEFIDAYLEPRNYLPAVLASINGRHAVRRRPRPYDVVVDLGGHVGLFSAFVSPAARRVVACEPVPAFQRLFDLTLSHLGAANVELCRKAIWTSSGERPVRLCPDNTTMHSLVGGGAEGDGALLVPTTSLGDLLTSYDIASVDLLKVDIEGAEVEFVYGEDFAASSHRVRSLWVECHPLSSRGIPAETVALMLAARLQVLGYEAVAEAADVFAVRA